MTFDVLRQLRNVSIEGRAMQERFAAPRTGNPLQTGGYTRSPVYQAERRVRAGIKSPYVLRSLVEVQIYGHGVAGLAAADWDRASWPLTFELGQDGRATYQSGKITSPVPVVQMTILHELAHHLAGNTDSDHDSHFMTAYVYLLRMEMGPDIAQKLLDALP